MLGQVCYEGYAESERGLPGLPGLDFLEGFAVRSLLGWFFRWCLLDHVCWSRFVGLNLQCREAWSDFLMGLTDWDLLSWDDSCLLGWVCWVRFPCLDRLDGVCWVGFTGLGLLCGILWTGV